MGHTVEKWFEHVEIAKGLKKGITNIGDIKWTVRIYNDFCGGKSSFGVTGTNGIEAIMQVIHKYNPEHYKLALEGLRLSIEKTKNKEKPLKKLTKMYHRILKIESYESGDINTQDVKSS